MSGTTIEGFNANQYVKLGGVAIAVTVSGAGDEQVVSASGTASITKIDDSTQFLEGGGTAIDTTINSGSTQI